MTTTTKKHPLNIGDVIEYQPRMGKPRIVEITATHPHGFDAVLTGNRLVRTFGFYAQVTRVLKRVGVEEIVHKTKTVKKGPGFVAWQCACHHTDVGVGETDDDAMHEARVQQRLHLDTVRDVA